MVEKPFKDEFKVKATRKALSKGNVRKIQLIVKTNHIVIINKTVYFTSCFFDTSFRLQKMNTNNKMAIVTEKKDGFNDISTIIEMNSTNDKN